MSSIGEGIDFSQEQQRISGTLCCSQLPGEPGPPSPNLPPSESEGKVHKLNGRSPMGKTVVMGTRDLLFLFLVFSLSF